MNGLFEPRIAQAIDAGSIGYGMDYPASRQVMVIHFACAVTDEMVPYTAAYMMEMHAIRARLAQALKLHESTCSAGQTYNSLRISYGRRIPSKYLAQVYSDLEIFLKKHYLRNFDQSDFAQDLLRHEFNRVGMKDISSAMEKHYPPSELRARLARFASELLGYSSIEEWYCNYLSNCDHQFLEEITSAYSYEEMVWRKLPNSAALALLYTSVRAVDDNCDVAC